MKHIVLTCIGLIGLSAASGIALFASHAALAAGPRLPDYVVRAHAIAASRTTETTPKATQAAFYAQPDLNEAYSAPTVLSETTSPVGGGQNNGQLVVSSQSSGADMYLAPSRVLRPVARPGEETELAQAVQSAPRGAEVVSSNRRAPTSVQTARTQRPVLLRTFAGARAADGQGNTGRIQPAYLHGVFR